MNALTPTWKRYGGEHDLAPQVVALMPPHRHYVEPFAGLLSVLLAKDPEGVSEVVNFKTRSSAELWTVLKKPRLFALLSQLVAAVPSVEADWKSIFDGLLRSRAEQGSNAADDNIVVRNAAYVLGYRHVRAGRTEASRKRILRGVNVGFGDWLTAEDGLPAVHARLRRVAIRTRPAIDVIRQEDGPDTLFYCEMRERAHGEVLDTIQQCQGKVVLSGYPSDMYDAALNGWNRHTFDRTNHAAGGGAKRGDTEEVWCNF